MMIYLIELKYGVVDVKNHNVKRTIVNVLLGIRNAHQNVCVKIVQIKKKFHHILGRKRNLKQTYNVNRTECYY
jgi:hypothetical protein